MSMYRQGALNYRRHAWSGKALLLSGLPMWLVGSFTLLFFVFFTTVLIFGTYTRRINVTGELVSVPRAITIMSTQQGFIINRRDSPGEHVVKGQPLYEIDVSRATTSGVVSHHQRQELEMQIRNVDNIIERQRENKRTTLDMLLKQQAHFAQAQQHSTEVIRKAEQGLSIMKQNMDNYRRYQQSGLITKDQLISQTALYYQQQNDLLSLSSQNEQNALQVLTLEGNMHTQGADFDNEIYRLQMQKSELERQLTDADAAGVQVVISPVDGRVDSLSVTNGQMVNTGDSLLQIVPGSTAGYELVLWVPDSAVPWLKLASRVNIRYDAFPAEKFGQFPGKISGISVTPASQQEMATYPAAPQPDPTNPQTWYKVTVNPDTTQFMWKGHHLTAENGMKATSTLFLEERQLYQWVLAPLYTLRDSAGGITHGQ